jgi:hypothetical protein
VPLIAKQHPSQASLPRIQPAYHPIPPVHPLLPCTLASRKPRVCSKPTCEIALNTHGYGRLPSSRCIKSEPANRITPTPEAASRRHASDTALGLRDNMTVFGVFLFLLFAMGTASVRRVEDHGTPTNLVTSTAFTGTDRLRNSMSSLCRFDRLQPCGSIRRHFVISTGKSDSPLCSSSKLVLTLVHAG